MPELEAALRARSRGWRARVRPVRDRRTSRRGRRVAPRARDGRGRRDRGGDPVLRPGDGRWRDPGGLAPGPRGWDATGRRARHDRRGASFRPGGRDDLLQPGAPARRGALRGRGHGRGCPRGDRARPAGGRGRELDRAVRRGGVAPVLPRVAGLVGRALPSRRLRSPRVRVLRRHLRRDRGAGRSSRGPPRRSSRRSVPSRTCPSWSGWASARPGRRPRRARSPTASSWAARSSGGCSRATARVLSSSPTGSGRPYPSADRGQSGEGHPCVGTGQARPGWPDRARCAI